VVRLQCVAALVLGAAVLLSALFWLPPFAGRGRGDEAPDPGAVFRGEFPPRPGIARSRFRFRRRFFPPWLAVGWIRVLVSVPGKFLDLDVRTEPWL
jgi:hypothetical protein